MIEQEKLDRQFEKATKACQKKMARAHRRGDEDKVNTLWNEYLSMAEDYYDAELIKAHYKFDEKGACNFEGMNAVLEREEQQAS